MEVEKERKSVGLEKKDAMNQAKWRVGNKDQIGLMILTHSYGLEILYSPTSFRELISLLSFCAKVLHGACGTFGLAGAHVSLLPS